MKTAEALKSLGFNVVLIEREASILPLAAHPETARILEAHLLKEGYELRLGAALAGVQVDGDAGHPGGTAGFRRATRRGGPRRSRRDGLRGLRRAG